MNAFSGSHHSLFEEKMHKICKFEEEVRFYLDVIQPETFARVLMDLKNISYEEAYKIMDPGPSPELVKAIEEFRQWQKSLDFPLIFS